MATLSQTTRLQSYGENGAETVNFEIFVMTA